MQSAAERIAEVAEYAPERLVINLGINDIYAGETGETVGNAIVAYLQMLIAKAELANTQICYNMMIAPVASAYNAYRAHIAQANTIVKSYIDGLHSQNVSYIDVNSMITKPNGEVCTKKFLGAPNEKYWQVEIYAIISEEIAKKMDIGLSVEDLNVMYYCSKYIGVGGVLEGMVTDEQGVVMEATVTVTSGDQLLEEITGKTFTVYDLTGLFLYGRCPSGYAHEQ